MELNCKLIQKSFTDGDGKSHSYYVLSFDLTDDETLEISVKGDKAKLLKLSKAKIEKESFWK